QNWPTEDVFNRPVFLCDFGDRRCACTQLLRANFVQNTDGYRRRLRFPGSVELHRRIHSNDSQGKIRKPLGTDLVYCYVYGLSCYIALLFRRRWLEPLAMGRWARCGASDCCARSPLYLHGRKSAMGCPPEPGTSGKNSASNVRTECLGSTRR